MRVEIEKERANPKTGKYHNDKSDKYVMNKFLKEL